MTTDQLIKNALQALSNLLPLIPLLGIVLVYRYFDKQSKKGRTDDSAKLSELSAALDKLWPLLATSDAVPTLVSQEPSAYFTVSKHVAERRARNIFNERLKP